MPIDFGDINILEQEEHDVVWGPTYEKGQGCEEHGANSPPFPLHDLKLLLQIATTKRRFQGVVEFGKTVSDANEVEDKKQGRNAILKRESAGINTVPH